MALSLDEVRRDARALSERERAQLLQTLILDLDAPLEADVDGAWLEESERRLAQVESGESEPLPGSSVITAARARLK
ncbi:MAG: addiction module protein [Steroidobacteraceae bacterium]|jgi:hypothetical protein|nr:addiction module protein [Steroidobacteraceae bacterium]